MTRPIIFYIDDEPHNLTVFDASVPEEWDVRLFSNAAAALTAVKGDAPAVVVSDQRMPGMTGLQLLELVSQLSPESTRIVVTGQTDESIIVDLIRRAQVFDYITKPWKTDDLISRIQRAVDFNRAVVERNEAFKNLTEKNRELESRNSQLIIVTKELETSRDTVKAVLAELVSAQN